MDPGLSTSQMTMKLHPIMFFGDQYANVTKNVQLESNPAVFEDRGRHSSVLQNASGRRRMLVAKHSK